MTSTRVDQFQAGAWYKTEEIVMAYSESKDVLIHLCQPTYRFDVDGNGQVISVGVYRYNGGPMKIGVQRQVMKGGQMTPSRLGRMTIDEAEYVFGALNEALKVLKEKL